MLKLNVLRSDLDEWCVDPAPGSLHLSFTSQLPQPDGLQHGTCREYELLVLDEAQQTLVQAS